MPKTLKLLLGAVTAAPILVVLYLLIRMLQLFSELAAAGGAVEPDRFENLFVEMLTVNVITGLVTLLLIVFYLWHVLVRRARRDPTRQILWVALIVLLPVIAMPIYWLLYIWPEQPDGEPAPARPA